MQEDRKEYFELQKQKNRKKGIFFFITVGVVAFLFRNKPKNTEGGNGGGDWTRGNTATITYNDALKIAEAIKKEIDMWVDWQAISNQFLKLRNDRDIEILYKAFGVWDGPRMANGDLFTVLNIAHTFLDDFDNKNALKIIKQYSFSYGKNWEW
jgi:hypothetical protein